MVQAGYSDFLGAKSSKFESNFCKVSIVNYQRAVSEEWHCHEDFHLSAILRGGNLESRKREEIQVLSGKVLIYQSGEAHRNRFTEFPSSNLILEIRDGFFKEIGLAPDSLKQFHTDSVDSYFPIVKIYHELHFNDRYTCDSIHALIGLIFSEKKKQHSSPLWLARLREIVHDRWDEFISLEELAYEAQVHPVTVSKYFHKYCGYTLADYMRKVKVDRAMHLILNSKKSMTEIAFMCGFSDQSHMARLFKHYLGFGPKELSRI